SHFAHFSHFKPPLRQTSKDLLRSLNSDNNLQLIFNDLPNSKLLTKSAFTVLLADLVAIHARCRAAKCRPFIVLFSAISYRQVEAWTRDQSAKNALPGHFQSVLIFVEPLDGFSS